MMPKLKDLNFEEQFIGFVFGLVFAFKIGIIFSFFLALCTIYLYAAGGAKEEDGGNKLYRRAGCSILPTLAVYMFNQHWDQYRIFMAVPIAWWVLSWGYGIPDSSDEGSLIGRFWYFEFERDVNMANIFTRSTIYLALAFSFIPVWMAHK